ncbi:hypothetical protein ACWC9U_07530 [Streptomyces sp. 900116325]
MDRTGADVSGSTGATATEDPEPAPADPGLAGLAAYRRWNRPVARHAQPHVKGVQIFNPFF